MSVSYLRVCSIAVLATGLLSSPATAFKKNLQGTRSKEYIQGLCSQVNGQYLEGQGQYGCMTNCGGKGPTNDSCGINCSEKTNECYGWQPGRVRTRNPIEILHPSSGGIKQSR
jgi:hypothetical protein